MLLQKNHDNNNFISKIAMRIAFRHFGNTPMVLCYGSTAYKLPI